MSRIQWLRAVAGVATKQLRHDRVHTLLTIVGIVLAVLATILLASTGVGVLETGTEQLDAADRDLWVTGGPVALASTGGGGFENTLLDTHSVAAEIESHPEVESAVPLGFEAVYVRSDESDYETLIGSGTTGGGPAITTTDGSGFTGEDTHYANGSYDGPMSNEVIVDERTAEMFDVEVGDSLYIGGSISSAERNEFTIVGVSPTVSQFLGAPTVTLRLSELQQVTGTTAVDPSTFITVTLESGADTDAVQADLQETYPEYDIRSNEEQLQAVLQNQALVLAGGVTLVVLAFVAGLTLTITLLGLVVHQQRSELAALQALGITPPTVVGIIASQGLILGTIGGLVAIAATPLAALGLNYLAATLVGFDGLVQPTFELAALGLAVAVGIGSLSASLSAWRLTRHSTVDQLR
ncbi:ABC transporter permease [Haloferacaceae archaeon DSL9]